MQLSSEVYNFFFNNPANLETFYVERNDFQRADLTLEQELGEMLSKGDIDLPTFNEIMSTKTVWSARIYDNNGNMAICYAATFENAINGLYKEINT